MKLDEIGIYLGDSSKGTQPFSFDIVNWYCASLCVHVTLYV